MLQSSITDALANVTQARVNLNGYRTQAIDPDRGTWKDEYDSLGELTKRTDAASNNLTFAAYDKLGRPVSRTELEGTTAFTWGQVSDNTGSEKYFGSLKKLEYTLTGQGSPNHTETYKYDDKSRYKQTHIGPTSDGSYDVDYAYDATTGLLDTVTYPTSNGTTRLQVKYQYQNGILTSVRNAAVGGTVFWQVNGSGMDAMGNLTDEQLGNGVRVKSTYDPTTGLLSTRKSGNDAPATNRQNLEYLWDANGNLTRRTDNRQTVGGVSFYEQFNYDEIDRLSTTASNAPGYTALTLTVNAIGNILTKSDFSPSTYTYPASGASSVRPHAVSSVGSSSYGYDANGNMNSRGGNSITWTTYGVPSAINGSGGLSSQFTYAPDRERWKQTATYPGTPAVTETTLYIGGVMEKVTRSDATATTYRHYISAGSSTVVFVNFSDATTPQTYYVTRDHLGSASMVTSSSSATIVVNESFSAFGARRDSDWVGPLSSTDEAAIKNSTRRGYTAHEHLDNLGLVHMNGRIQDPALGRFISADPFIPNPGNSQSLNRYSYVRNGPLSATDPSGFQDNTDCTGCANWLFLNQYTVGGSWDVEGRANGAVAGLRPDVTATTAVGAASAGGLAAMTQAGAMQSTARGTCGSGGIGGMCHLGPDQWQVDPRSRIADIPIVSSIDYGLGWLTQGLWDGPVRGLLSNVEPGGRALMDSKFLLVTSAAAPLTGAAGGSAVIDTSSVRFTQSSIRGTFSDGRTLQSTIDALSGPNGATVASQIAPIRIFGGPNGLLYTLDNRRLAAFAAAGRPVPYRWAASDETASEMWKMTLTSEQLEGWFIRVKP